jgi:hypothetical protein
MIHMTRSGDITTTTLNRHGGFFQLEDGTIIDIAAMVDERGNVADPDAATIGIYELPCDGLYRAADLRLFSDENGSKPVRPSCPAIKCTAVNKRDRYFRLENGGRLDIATMLDIDLRPTTDPDAMTVAIFRLPDGLYRGIDLRPMDDPDNQESLQ